MSINGIRAAAIVSTLGRYAAVDGFTDFARASLLESDDDLMASNLEHYWPVQYGFAKEWKYVVRSASGVERTTTLQPITYDAWIALGGGPRQVDFTNGTSWRMLDSTTALLTIRSFVNYRTPINADSLYASIVGQLRTRGVTHVILDLRENGGGSDDASSGLIRWLADRPVQPNTSVRRRTINITGPLASAFETWGNKAAVLTPAAALFERRDDGWYNERGANAVITPSPDAFPGRVSVLMGRRNGSGATMLLAVLQEMGARTGRLRLVGEESGGSAEGPTAGQILSLKLPNSGMRVRIPLKRSDVNVTTFVPGLGVFPDVDATETLADFRARIDKALLFARVTPWTRSASPLAPTVGLMRGELEYSDYTTQQRTTLQTWMHTAPIGNTGAFRQRTIYDDGPGKTIYTVEVVTVSGDRWIEGETGRGGRSLRVVSREQTPEGQQLRLRGSGVDDDTPVDFRYTVTLSPTSYTRLKEFRPKGKTGTPFTFRHVYRFQRAN